MNIRLETKNDYSEVENITREAFRNVYRPGCFEHLVVHNLRSNSDFVSELDFIIEEGNRIIGNIIYALGNINTNGNNEKVLIFGPVSILPEYQHKGFGEELINHSLEKAKKLGYSSVFITGNPEYYKKFGFESASKYDIHYEGMPIKDDAPFFMVKILDKSKFNYNGGTYSAPECYNIDETELENFDKQFPPKDKKVLPGQLG